jgi:YggT family protein
VYYALMTLDVVMTTFVFFVLISAMLSWMVAFKLVKAEKSLAAYIGDMVFRVTEPVLWPVRFLLPNSSGMDISPVIVVLALLVASRWLREFINVAAG